MPARSRSRVLAVLVIGVVVAGAASGCTGVPGDADGHSPGAGPSVAASPTAESETPSGGAEADSDALPLPRDEIPDWAATALPPQGAAPRVIAQSGGLGPGTSTRLTVSAPEAPAGRYAVDVACLGAGTVTVHLTEPEDAASPDAPDATCSDETISFEYDSSPDAPRLSLGLVGDPTVYAVAVAPVTD
ncbi:hypothetical protein [Frigoribacterium sp. Leaf172]|uniref:hypothetical protein n=1 Tax=Frigoribacterium sp. Leaf172 TaxID=1736285 RepID=UPI0006F390A9|nr:hypothetical protein [Frigoribacterium sp. Leaf172]KQR65016.1 hypothetical protein ASF89_11595 [Frigoribacterium sp. Leaf172]